MSDDFPDLELRLVAPPAERVDAAAADAGEDLWPSRACVVCQTHTHLRCAECLAYVCVRHDCPAGCDAPRAVI